MVAKTECPECGKEATYNEKEAQWECECEWVKGTNRMQTEKVMDLITKYYGESAKTDDEESKAITLNVINNGMMTHQIATHMKTKSIEQLIHFVVDKYDLTDNGKLSIEQYLKLGDEIEKLIPILVE